MKFEEINTLNYSLHRAAQIGSEQNSEALVLQYIEQEDKYSSV